MLGDIFFFIGRRRGRERGREGNLIAFFFGLSVSWINYYTLGRRPRGGGRRFFT